MISRRSVMLAPLVLIACAGAAAAATPIEVIKTPTCGCCRLWVEHLRAEGFDATVIDLPDLDPVARSLFVPDDLRSCHTARIGGYAVEGHVPAADIRRLLAERPVAAGIAAPGMPLGSPGMEQGGRSEPYQVILFTRDGRRSLFAQH